MLRVMLRLLADAHDGEPSAPVVETDDPGILCPMSSHDLKQQSETVYRCDEHGVTLILHATDPAPDLPPRPERAPFAPTPRAGRHRRPDGA
ncbi:MULTISPECIES: hypothetical protein [Streptomyces]|uniref:Uncharacterized protein n=1 Tax=Streptomyces ramulosus TaxID=47762 RepID=A0ABW1FRR0_9ACTN